MWQMIDDCCSILGGKHEDPAPILQHERGAGLHRRPAPSGTTLLEQFIDAHPDAAGIGELSTIDIMADLLKSDYPWPGSLGEIDESMADQMARDYMKAAVDCGGRNRKRLINKSLQNWTRLPLIAMLLPKARVIHIRRDPRDVAVSCFMSSMHPRKNRWTNDVSDILWMSKECDRPLAPGSRLRSSIHRCRIPRLVHDLEGRPDG